ncbi:GNAT family N-acetyltransferase [Winogradskyella maritima]|uniref:GNAT family N-acetyltransferase n=1 Tax=Winogradskyella maritima TaxID=1517766 RepID=A0ABV8AH20_9FLAO|nr:GNAT family N-acetyltransferase [Winogradskyella maritima]
MEIKFEILPNSDLGKIIPLVFKLNEGRVSETLLKERFNEMKHQNYECAVIYDGEQLIGVSGLWFCTRHYTGKSVELDHVYISDAYRGQGLGKRFMSWIKTYVEEKGCKSMELNTYVHNYPSHKFYYNDGYEAWGYHFFKKI